jgi:hypothetical protein
MIKKLVEFLFTFAVSIALSVYVVSAIHEPASSQGMASVEAQRAEQTKQAVTEQLGDKPAEYKSGYDQGTADAASRFAEMLHKVALSAENLENVSKANEVNVKAKLDEVAKTIDQVHDEMSRVSTALKIMDDSQKTMSEAAKHGVDIEKIKRE